MATIRTTFFSRGQATSAIPAFAGVAAPQRGIPTTPPHLVGFAASYGDAFACSGPDRSTRQAVHSHLGCCHLFEHHANAALRALSRGDSASAARWFGAMNGLVNVQTGLRPIGTTPAWQLLWGETQGAWSQTACVAGLFGVFQPHELQSHLRRVIDRNQTCWTEYGNIPHRTASTRKDLADRALRKMAASADITPVEGGLALVALRAADRRPDPEWSTKVKILAGIPLALPLRLDENPFARALLALLNWTWEPNSTDDDGGTIRFHDPDLTPKLAQDFETSYADTVGDVQ